MGDLKGMLILMFVLFAGQLISDFFGILLPGPVLAMILMVFLLALKVVKVQSIDKTCNFLHANMIVCFVSSGVSLMKIFNEVQGEIVRIFIVAALSTAIIIAVTSFTVDRVIRLMKKNKEA